MRFSIFTLLLIFSLLLNSTYVNGQTVQNHKLNEKLIDSVITTILILKESDSVKIAKLNQIIADNRYAKYTIKAIKVAEKIAKSSKNKVLIVDNYRSFGNYYFYNSQLDSATYYLLKSKKNASNLPIPFIKAAINNALGGVYRKKGNVSKAISSLLESKTILLSIDTLKLTRLKKRQLNIEQLTLFNTLANFYNQMGDYPKAINNYNKAYKKALTINAVKYAGVILSNKGDLLLNNNEFKKALDVLKRAKNLKIKGHAKESSIANTNQNISLVLLKMKIYDLALVNINKAIDYYTKNNVVSGLMEALTIRGTIYYGQKKYQKAIDNCLKSKQLSFKNNVLEMQEKSCKCLSEAYAKTKNYQNAYQNHKLYQIAKDSIFNKNNIKKITQLEMQYAYDKENKLLEMQIDSTKKENKATVKILTISIISLVLISTLLFGLFYIRQKANSTLKEKNKKISETLVINKTLFKETHHRVKNNLQIVSSLLNMQAKFLEDEKSKKIINDSQNRIKSMSLIHQKLYQENNITGIETKAYFTDLIHSLALSYGIDISKVKMHIAIENILLDVDTAIPLGLILNELISNAFKHGINKETGEFSIVFKQPSDTYLFLKIKDNGPGLSKDFNLNNSESYGMKLIHSLSKKLKADLVFKNNNGTEISMKITKFKLS